MAVVSPSDPSYYDLLRTDPDGMGVLGTSIDDTGESNVVEFTVSGEAAIIAAADGSGSDAVVEEGSGSEGLKYYLADLTSLLPYTICACSGSGGGSNGGSSKANTRRYGVHNDAAALLLAIHHFNNGLTPSIITGSGGGGGGGSTSSASASAIAAAYANCRVRLTTQLHDTSYSPIQSTRTLTTVLDRIHSPSSPLPAAVLGAYRSASTSPTAILSGVNDVPQLSYRSSSTDFDNKEQYPMFGRTVPSSASDARAVVSYLTTLGVEYVGVIFVTDAFGSSYQKSLQDAAGDVQPPANPIRTDSVSFSYTAAAAATDDDDDDSNDEIANAIASLKATRYRYFLALIGEEHYDRVMTEAARQGLVGAEGYVWIFVGGVSREVWQVGARYEKGSALADATDGIALIQVEGGPTTETVSADASGTLSSAPVGPDPVSSTYGRFRQLWSEAMSDPAMVEYFWSKQPDLGLDDDGESSQTIEFSPEPTQFSYFIWDAVQSLGFGMCMASQSPSTNSGGGGPFFSGKGIYANFTGNVTFEGASGVVEIDGETGTRDPTGVTYTVWNARARSASAASTSHADGGGDGKEYVVFDLVPTSHYVQQQQQPEDDGAAAVDPEYGTDGQVMRWENVPGQPFLYNGGTAVQPVMLPPPEVNNNYIGNAGRIVGYVLMGVVMALSVVSVAWTGWLRKTRVVRASSPLFLTLISVGCLVMSSAIVPLSMEETTVQSEEGLDKACMAAPWLYVLGFASAFAALLTKTWTINKVYRNPDVDSIVVRPLDLFKTLAALLLVNVALLLSWNLVSPLEWERIPKDSKDSFERTTETYATCTSDKALSFVIVIIVINLGALIFANWQAYRARDVQTEYHESRYIAISMASILQAWCMGIPIMIVVKDSPQAKFFVAAGIIFVTCTAVLLLMFVPKVLSVRADRRKEEEEERRTAIRSINARAGRGEFDEDEDEDEPNPQADTAESSYYGTSQTGEPNAPSAAVSAAGDTDVTEGATSKDASDDFENESRRQGPEQWTRKGDVSPPGRDIEGGGSVASAGLKVVHNPSASRRQSAELRAQLAQAQEENIRLHSQNAQYEQELNMLREEEDDDDAR